jgi:hypothetical protein
LWSCACCAGSAESAGDSRWREASACFFLAIIQPLRDCQIECRGPWS